MAIWRRGLILILPLLASLISVELFADTIAGSGFEMPPGTIELVPVKGQSPRVALVDFFTENRSANFSESVLQIIEHDLMFRTGYQGRYDVLNRDELKALIKKELKRNLTSPLDVHLLKRLLNVDYFVFLDERLHNRDWQWVLRVYNARSGAFVESATVPFTQYHLRWTLDRLLQHIDKILFGPVDRKVNQKAPKEVLLERSLLNLPRFNKACGNNRCLSMLNDFEWIRKNNPEFFISLMRNPLYFNSLHKEATRSVDFARIDFLEDNPMEVSVRLVTELNKTRSRKSRIRYLELIEKAMLEMERPGKANEFLVKLREIDPKNLLADYAQGWLAFTRKQYPEGAKYLRNYVKRRPEDIAALKIFIKTLLNSNQLEEVWKVKAELVKQTERIGNFLEANDLYLELLDHEFTMEILNKINIVLLSDMDRKRLATMLNQYGIVHDANEGDVFRKIADVTQFEGKMDEARRVINGALQIDPDNINLIEMSVWDSILRKGDFANAQGLLDQLPVKSRDPYMEALLFEKSKQYDKAINIWKRTKWKNGWKYESSIKIAALLHKLNKQDEALKAVQKSQNVYNGREDLFELLSTIYEKTGKRELAKHAKASAWQLAGRRMDFSKDKGHLFFADYLQLLMPFPLTGRDEAEHVSSVGKVIILDGTPLVEKEGLKKYLDYVSPYKKSHSGRLVREIKQVISQRYEIVENAGVEEQFRKRLNQTIDGSKTRYTKEELLELASNLGADSAFIIHSDEFPEMDRDLLEISLHIYFYDGVSNEVFMTGFTRTFPFFKIYKFNRLLIAGPVLLLIILFLIYLKFARLTKFWRDPIMHANHLTAHKNYYRAAEILERHGYLEDHLMLLGHHYAYTNNHAKALETFVRARDFDNALIALKGCPDTDEVNNIAADFFFQQKNYEQAAQYYYRTKNLLGLKKIYESNGDAKKAGRIMGQYYFENNNPISAIEEYRKVGAYNEAGIVFFYYRKFKEALMMFRQAKNKDMYKKCKMMMGERSD